MLINSAKLSASLLCVGHLSLALPTISGHDLITSAHQHPSNTNLIRRDGNPAIPLNSTNPNPLGPAEPWSKTTDDYQLTMSNYGYPYSSYRDAVPGLYEDLKAWMIDFLTEESGGSMPSPKSEWPVVSIDETLRGYRYQIGPTIMPGQSFTVGQNFATLDLVHLWLQEWAWEGEIPSASMTVTSVSKGVVVAKGRLVGSGNGKLDQPGKAVQTW